MATIEKRSQGQFRARIRRRGQPEQTRTFPTRALAEAWARSIETRVDAGEVLLTREAARTTLAEALDRYDREITPAKRGARQEVRRIEAWKARSIALKPMAAIRGADVAAFRDDRLRQVGPNTVRLELALLSHVYKIARTEWGMEGLANPCDSVRKPKAGQPRTRRLLAGELDRIMAHASPVLQAAITLAIETAMRRGELAATRREHVKGRTLHVPATKNGDPRAVPLSLAALAAIDAMPLRMDGYLLGWPGTVRDDLTHGFGEACKAAGVVGLRFHDLRREAISRLFEKGLTIAEVREVSGHKTLSQLATYTRGNVERLVAKLDMPAMQAA